MEFKALRPDLFAFNVLATAVAPWPQPGGAAEHPKAALASHELQPFARDDGGKPGSTKRCLQESLGSHALFCALDIIILY